jgi:multicomponent Na+:H+ antiporter subunit C
MEPFLVAGVALFALGLYGVLAGAPLLRRLLAANIMGNGTFLVLMATGHESKGAGAGDPVAHALVLTGIVVAVSATALGLELACRLREATADGDRSG